MTGDPRALAELEAFAQQNRQNHRQPPEVGAGFSFPPVTRDVIEACFARAEYISLSDPWQAWRLCYLVAAATERQDAEPYLQARAAWNLGWAANECTEPQLARQALAEAKRLFAQVGDRGWLAACEWQDNALPWTKPNFLAAEQALEQALNGLCAAGMDAFIPRCQLSLAYANILLSTPEALKYAEELIDAAEGTFRLAADSLFVLKAQLLRPSLLVRKGQRLRAVSALNILLNNASSLGMIVDSANASFQLGLNLSHLGEDISLAQSQLQHAMDTFHSAGLLLWVANCLAGMGILQTRQGSYQEAETTLKAAHTILEQYQIPGMLADNLIDSGRIALFAGHYKIAITRFNNSIAISNEINAKLSRLIAKMNLGYTYTKLGNNQSAMICLEDSCSELEQLNNPGRLADCRFYLARVWMQLGHFSEALTLLDSIEITAPPELKALAFEVGLAKAYCLISTQHPEAHDFILQQMERWRDSQAKPDLPLLKQALGLLLFNQGQTEAETVLQSALSEFQALGLAEEEASCQALLGELYTSSNRQVQAITAWRTALARVPTGVPELRIACLASLGGIYEDLSDQIQALDYYRQVSQVFIEITPDFWQASIFSWYTARLSPNLEKALRFFCSQGLFGEALALIENLKAHTFKYRLSWGDAQQSLASDKTKQLKNQIDAAQERIKSASQGVDWLASLARTQAEQTRLAVLSEELEQEYGRLQRQNTSASRQFKSHFDVSEFQQVASQRLGRSWVALDYYLTNQEIFVACITANDFTFHAKELSPRLQMALAACSANSADAAPPSADLQLLARQLLPAELLAQQPGAVLIISAHQSLGALPWAGLPWQQGLLVDAFSPVLAPSLESMQLLWQRSQTRASQSTPRVAFVGLSKFAGGPSELPLVMEEYAALKGESAVSLDALINEEASQKAVTGLFQDVKADILHLATHVHYDERSNYLCSIQLGDGPAWSEELFASQQLPNLVFLSACNGASSFIYEGGEPTGLSLTCLVRGAQAVVGSQHPISDPAALQLTQSFYNQFLQGAPAATALAQAQRRLRAEGSAFCDWAYLVCLGIPDWALVGRGFTDK